MKRFLKPLLTTLTAAAAVALLVLAFQPKPVPVESARADRGPLQVTIDEDGETRAHDRFTLAAPIAGRLSRIDLHEGDEVSPNTVIATINPLPLDAREVAEIRARVQSAEAKQREAAETLARWDNDCAQAKRELDRIRNLARERLVPQQDLEAAESKYTSASKELEAAKFRAQAAAADVTREKAGLISLEAQRDQAVRAVVLRAPTARCRILRILEKSERVVPFGTPIVTLSNPSKLEIVVDLLSTDAVKVRPGAPVIVDNWGGPKPLRGRVRNVEPYGFTKVSVLGVEEQRVNVIVDFVDPPGPLGDGYHVDARIVIWESQDVLKVPASALFRSGGEKSQWSVFVVDSSTGRAKIQAVETGHRNASEAEILSGLEAGTQVILHPPNDLKPGARVAAAN